MDAFRTLYIAGVEMMTAGSDDEAFFTSLFLERLRQAQPFMEQIGVTQKLPEESRRIIDVSTCPVCGAREHMNGVIETLPAYEIWVCENGHRREIQQSEEEAQAVRDRYADHRWR